MGRDLDNPVVYQFYTSTNPLGKHDGIGFRSFVRMLGGKDFEDDCADCHVPVQVIKAHKEGKEVDLGRAMEEKTDHGISCHFCHSIKAVHITKDANGRYNTRIFDTVTLEEEEGTYHGPFATTEAGHETRQNSLFRKSEICGVCHLNQEKLLSISTYDDWKKAFDSGKTSQTCQECHMPIVPGKARAAVGGALREGLRSHTFVGARDAGMRKKALSLDVRTTTKDGMLLVHTTVENVGAGHTVPASAPIRNVILKVDVTDENGKPLPYAGDKKGLLPRLAGFGDPRSKKRGPGDWAGMPGKMYAKVYMSQVIPKLGRRLVGVGGFAADKVLFNTLLQPKTPDSATFKFDARGVKGEVLVKVRLVYRWAYKPLADLKGWKLEDLPMREATVRVHLN